MPLTARRGFTLLELLIALILLGVIGAAVGRALISQRRAAMAMLDHEQDQRILDQAAGWIGAELADLGRADAIADLLRVADDSLSYRAFRSVGLACLVAPGEVRIRLDLLSQWRMPQPGRDSLQLFLGRDSFPGGGGWTGAPITSVGASTCDGLPALRLGTTIGAALVAGLPVLVPARTFEVMQLRRYRSQGEWWLGARSETAGEVIQPVTGPLAPQGLRLTYRDSQGVEVLIPDLVRQVQVDLTPARQTDSVRLLVLPRNFW